MPRRLPAEGSSDATERMVIPQSLGGPVRNGWRE